MTFRVGQKVVCVNVKGNHLLRKDEIYTITGLSDGAGRPLSEPGMFLAEVMHALGTPFYASRFRPVVERKTDISVFTEILRKATKPACVPSVAITQHQGN